MMVDIRWLGSGRKSKCGPNPKYPNGIDVDISKGAEVTCTFKLPYPAEECGSWLVSCDTCGVSVFITAAGRIDDPKSVKVACKKENQNVYKKY